jgi:hypothetical protein
VTCAACEATKRALDQVRTERDFLKNDLRERVAVLERCSATGMSPTPATWRNEWPQPDTNGPTRTAVWKRGFVAAVSTLPRTACPYRGNSRGHDDAWRRGWDAGAAWLRAHPSER